MVEQGLKDEYIFNCFGKIRHKSEELYAITRIFHRLDDLDLEFVCQQKVRKSDGELYLVDLFFPQLSIFLEVNEAYHIEQEQANHDKFRMQQIWEITGWEAHIISTHVGIERVNKKIDAFIEILRSKKRNLQQSGQFKPWIMSPVEKAALIKKRNYLSVTFNDCLPTQADVTRLFGANHQQWMKGSFPYRKPFAVVDKMVWFPKLYQHSVWTNELSTDGQTIFERLTTRATIALTEDLAITRITFGHYKDPLGKTTYLYVGEFSYDREASTDRERVYRRVANKTDLEPFQIDP